MTKIIYKEIRGCNECFYANFGAWLDTCRHENANWETETGGGVVKNSIEKHSHSIRDGIHPNCPLDDKKTIDK